MIERVNGFLCLSQEDVALARKEINPAQPQLGPQYLGPITVKPPATRPQSSALAAKVVDLKV